MSKIKKTLLASAAAPALLLSAFAAHAATITVYVAANFADTLVSLESRYDAAHGTTNTWNNVVGATGNLLTGIETGGYSTYSQADLFFAANVTAIGTLQSSYTTRITYYSPTTTKYGWIYAEGFLELYSNTSGVNVGPTASGGTNGLDNIGFPFSPTLVIANPGSAPYGCAAATLINNAYGLGWSNVCASTITVGGSSGLVTASDIGVTYNDVFSHTNTWGFVALSQIGSYDPDTYVLSYPTAKIGANGTHFPYDPGSSTYNPILQGAVKVNGTGSTALRDDFVSWLSNRDAQSILLKGGYRIPYPIFL